MSWKFRPDLIRILIVMFGLMNAGCRNKKTNHKIQGKRVIFTGTSIYQREAVSNKNIGLVARIRIQFTIVLASVKRNGCSPSRLIQTLPGYLLHAPPYGQVWHKAFFRWVRAQGRNPHAPGISPKCRWSPRHSPY